MQSTFLSDWIISMENKAEQVAVGSSQNWFFNKLLFLLSFAFTTLYMSIRRVWHSEKRGEHLAYHQIELLELLYLLSCMKNVL